MADGDRDESSAENWWLYRTLANGSRQDRVELERGESPRALAARRGYELVQQLIDQGGDGAIHTILGLLDAAPNDHEIVAVGAGPLEDLINAHGDTLVDLVEQTARQRPDFAASLGSVAVEEGRLRPDTMGRLTRWLPRP